jgi:hypothetical protein
VEPTSATAKTSESPSTRPPIIAPGSDPMPPTMITARPFSSTEKPMFVWIELKARPKRTPATPPSADDRKNVWAVTSSTFTPSSAAARGLSATVRRARPKRVLRTSHVSHAMRPMLTPMTTSWMYEIRLAPSVIAPSGKVPSGNRCTFGPKMPFARATNMIERARELISPEKCVSGRDRSGAKATRSMTTPMRPAAMNAMSNAAGSGNPSVVTATSPMNAPSMKTEACARFRTSSTPKTSV